MHSHTQTNYLSPERGSGWTQEDIDALESRLTDPVMFLVAIPDEEKSGAVLHAKCRKCSTQFCDWCVEQAGTRLLTPDGKPLCGTAPVKANNKKKAAGAPGPKQEAGAASSSSSVDTRQRTPRRDSVGAEDADEDSKGPEWEDEWQDLAKPVDAEDFEDFDMWNQ